MNLHPFFGICVFLTPRPLHISPPLKKCHYVYFNYLSDLEKDTFISGCKSRDV